MYLGSPRKKGMGGQDITVSESHVCLPFLQLTTAPSHSLLSIPNIYFHVQCPLHIPGHLKSLPLWGPLFPTYVLPSSSALALPPTSKQQLLGAPPSHRLSQEARGCGGWARQ